MLRIAVKEKCIVLYNKHVACVFTIETCCSSVLSIHNCCTTQYKYGPWFGRRWSYWLRQWTTRK